MRFVRALIAALLLAVFTVPQISSPPAATRALQSDDSEVTAMLWRLAAVPVFTNLTSERVYEIFERGQALGNRPNVFTTVGDSNTTNGDFMRPIGRTPDLCEWGPYEDLKETVAFFSLSPRENMPTSFANDSVAADIGFSTATVLSPPWADWRLCDNNETPLACEYRIVKPSISVIMLGQDDINYAEIPTDRYRANMEVIVQNTIDMGVIPVLNTIVFLPHREAQWRQSLEFNMVILDIAEANQTPLINLWAAVQPLPNQGIGADNSHLKAEVGRFCDFNGGEQELGGALRNLLTLQALDELRRNVLTQ